MATKKRSKPSKKKNSRIAVLSRPAGRKAVSSKEATLWLGQVSELVDRKPTLHIVPPTAEPPVERPASAVQRPAAAPFDGDEQPRLAAIPLAALRAILADGARPAVEPSALRTRLDELYTWQNEATVELHDLAARRRGIGAEAQPLPRGMQKKASATTRSLIGAMSKSALDISKLEAADGRWLAAAEAARNAIRLRNDVAREALSEPLAPNPQAHLSLAYATFMIEGNSPRLREELARATELMPDSAGIAYWQARYAIMAGDYPTAYNAMLRAPDYQRIVEEIRPILQPTPAINPWESYPCNFYTYRYTLIDNDQINATKLVLSDAGETELGQNLGKTVADAAKFAALKATEYATLATGLATNVQVVSRLYPAPGEGPGYAVIQASLAGQKAADAANHANNVATSAASGNVRTAADEAGRTAQDVLDVLNRAGFILQVLYRPPAADAATLYLLGRMTIANNAAADARDALIKATSDLRVLSQPEQQARLKAMADIALKALNCFVYWNQGNDDLAHAKDSSAARNYAACQKAILEFFAARYNGAYQVPSQAEGIYSELVRVATHLIVVGNPAIWNHFRTRYAIVLLDDLHDHDWERPKVAPTNYLFYQDPLALLNTLAESSMLGLRKIAEKIEAPLLAIALIFAPLAMAEASRMRRDFDTARRECEKILTRHLQIKILCQHIEVPFIKILIGQILLEKADSQYKARLITGANQRLVAEDTYNEVLAQFQYQGQYVRMVNNGATVLERRAMNLLKKGFHPLSTVNPIPLPPVGQPRLFPEEATPQLPLSPDERHELQVFGTSVLLVRLTPCAMTNFFQ